MSIIDDKTKRFAANTVFPSFLQAGLGLLLVQAGAVQMHGSWWLHVFLGVPALALSGLTLFRARLHWPRPSANMPSLGAHALRWYLLLFVAGACVGVLMSSGSALLLGMAAALTYLLPWMKIPVCRGQFVVSSMLAIAGAVAWVVMVGRPVQPLDFMIAGWILYVPSMFMHLFVLVSLERGYRRPCASPRQTGA